MVDVQHDTPKKRTLTLSSDWYSDFLTGTIDTPTTSHRHRCSSPGIRGRKGLSLSLRRRRGGGECVRARECVWFVLNTSAVVPTLLARIITQSFA